MQIGRRTNNIKKQGLVNTAKTVNILRNQNFEQKQFVANANDDGVNVALRNPYEQKSVSFYCTFIQTPAAGGSTNIVLAYEHKDYLWTFDNTASEETRKIVKMPSGGKYLVNFFATCKATRTSAAPSDSYMIGISARLTSSGVSVSDAVSFANVFIPGKHIGGDDGLTTLLAHKPAPNNGVATNVEFDPDDVDYAVLEHNTLNHLPVGYTTQTISQQGSASAIIDTDADLNADHEMSLTVTCDVKLGSNIFISTAGTGMVITGPISYGDG